MEKAKERLQKAQAEQRKARIHDADIISRLASLESIIYSDTSQKCNGSLR